MSPVEGMPSPAPPDRDAQRAAQVLGESYGIERELGRGSLGIVYAARDLLNDRPVAIKVLYWSLSADQTFVAMFRDQAGIATTIAHPNVVRVVAAGERGGVAWYAMPLMRGGSLAALVETRGALPPSLLRKALTDACRGLAAAHARNLVHRNIKPDNILLDEGGCAVVADFGAVNGTPGYMSPEQEARRTLDGRADLFSLGVVAFQCLTGALPADRDAYSIRMAPPPTDLVEPPDLPPGAQALFAVIARMAAPDRERRYASAADVISALEGLAPV